MLDQELISLVENYKSNCREFKQLTFYPNISQESLNPVSDKFPEFDSNIETPLLLCMDGSRFIPAPRWLMLTDVRLYYYLEYFPDKFDALSCIQLNDINSFRMMYNMWKQDDYVEINSKKVGSLEIKNNNEKRSLSQFIYQVTDHIKTKGIVIEEGRQEDFYETLENAVLFSIARDYFNEVNRGGRLWEFEDFYYGPFIPTRKQEDWQEYAVYDIEREVPILFIDNSSRIIEYNSGVVITNKNIYYKLKKQPGQKKFLIGRIPLSQIKKFQISFRFSGWMVINDGKWKFVLPRFIWVYKKEAKVIESLMQKFIKQIYET